MDQPEPPKIVLEQPAPCADARVAQDLLTRTLAPSKAPRRGWTVTVRVRRDKGGLTAEGEITDDVDAPVAHRAITKETRECGAIARAVGVWASLVLDEEVTRASAEALPAPPEPDPSATPWPAPQPNAVPAPEQAVFLKNPEERRNFEIGAGASYMYGVLGDGGVAIAGAHVYSVVEIDGGWFLRPTFALGRSLKEVATATAIDATWGAARFDACGRLPGNYVERRGMQMDLCGGTEVGFVAFEAGSATMPSPKTIPLLAPGGTLALRGELASDLSAEVRGLVGVNVLRERFLDTQEQKLAPLLVYARLELGLSWRFR